jgi:hypothetical protein
MPKDNLIPTYWLYKWADINGIDRKNAKDALDYKMYLFENTSLDEDEIEGFTVLNYQKKGWESFGEKLLKACKKGNENLVKVTSYEGDNNNA